MLLLPPSPLLLLRPIRVCMYSLPWTFGECMHVTIVVRFYIIFAWILFMTDVIIHHHAFLWLILYHISAHVYSLWISLSCSSVEMESCWKLIVSLTAIEPNSSDCDHNGWTTNISLWNNYQQFFPFSERCGTLIQLTELLKNFSSVS